MSGKLHAQERLLERFGLDVSFSELMDIKALCVTANRISRPEPDMSIHVVQYREQFLPILIHDDGEKTRVVTFLKPEYLLSSNKKNVRAGHFRPGKQKRTKSSHAPHSRHVRKGLNRREINE